MDTKFEDLNTIEQTMLEKVYKNYKIQNSREYAVLYPEVFGWKHEDCDRLVECQILERDIVTPESVEATLRSLSPSSRKLIALGFKASRQLFPDIDPTDRTRYRLTEMGVQFMKGKYPEWTATLDALRAYIDEDTHE